MLKNRGYEICKKDLEHLAYHSMYQTEHLIEKEHAEDKETCNIILDYINKLAKNDNKVKACIYERYLTIVRYEDIYAEFVKAVKGEEITNPISVEGFTAKDILNTPAGAKVLLWAYVTLAHMRKDKDLVALARRGFPIK